MSDDVWKPNRRTLIKAGAGALAVTAPAPTYAEPSTRGGKYEELLNYDAVGLAQLIRSGQLSATEVVEAAIQRIEALDSKINALTTRTFTRALERVELISPDTLFAGVPTLLKDLVDVAGVRRTSGSLLDQCASRIGGICQGDGTRGPQHTGHDQYP